MIGIGAAELLVIAIALLLALALMAIPATLSYIVLNRIPESHRKQKPELSFLLLIPLFSLVWQFFVYPKISESLRSYYSDRIDRPAGDYGAGLALWGCICSIFGLVPVLGLLFALASLILIIIFFVKALDLSKKIQK